MPKRFFLASLSITTLLLSACTPVQFANAFVSGDLRLEEDIAYGPLPRQRLDVYTSGRAETPGGVVVFFHGGYWDSGDKGDYPFLADSLAEGGFVTVIPNYRLVPEVTFPAYVEDGALAVKWAIEAFPAEPIFLMGHSSGAHLAALLAYDERYLEPLGLENRDLAGFIGLAGPYDFLPLAPDDLRAQAALGPEAGYPETQPIAFVDGNEAPALLLVGLDDATVNPDNSRRMATRIVEQGGRAELVTYEGLEHIEIVGALARAGRLIEPKVLEDVLRFLNAESQAR